MQLQISPTLFTVMLTATMTSKMTTSGLPQHATSMATKGKELTITEARLDTLVTLSVASTIECPCNIQDQQLEPSNFTSLSCTLYCEMNRLMQQALRRELTFLALSNTGKGAQ